MSSLGATRSPRGSQGKQVLHVGRLHSARFFVHRIVCGCENFMSKPKITAWLKPSCGWSNGVRAVLKKYELPFDDRDVINNADIIRRW